MWTFHVLAKKCANNRDARAELLFFSLNLLFFWRSPCRRRRSFVRSLLHSGVWATSSHKKKILIIKFKKKTVQWQERSKRLFFPFSVGIKVLSPYRKLPKRDVFKKRLSKMKKIKHSAWIRTISFKLKLTWWRQCKTSSGLWKLSSFQKSGGKVEGEIVTFD